MFEAAEPRRIVSNYISKVWYVSNVVSLNTVRGMSTEYLTIGVSDRDHFFFENLQNDCRMLTHVSNVWYSFLIFHKYRSHTLLQKHILWRQQQQIVYSLKYFAIKESQYHTIMCGAYSLRITFNSLKCKLFGQMVSSVKNNRVRKLFCIQVKKIHFDSVNCC